jgi:photosystem II stability/assembly factor-like uncharacterized protein
MTSVSLRTVRRAAAGCLAATTLGSAASPAFANGRYPLASQVAIAPGEASFMALRSTFGLVQTFDAGKTWSWICEKSAGYSDYEDPSVAITENGTLIVGSDGVSVSRDRGCSWTIPEQLPPPTVVTDLDVDRAHPSHILVLVGSADSVGNFTNQLYESSDNGASWGPLGAAIQDGLVGQTLEVTASGRIYLSGKDNTTSQGVLQYSDDRAMSWIRYPIGLEGSELPFIAAVDPVTENRVYVRSIAADGDRLFVSDDAGSSFRQVFIAPGGLYGFALSPDGKEVAAGGPKVGVNVASSADHVFAQVSTVGPYCLRWTTAGLYACAKEAIDHFAVGLSMDRGAHFESILHLADIAPLACAPDTATGSLCGQYWGQVAGTIGADAGGADIGVPDGPNLNPVTDDGKKAGCHCRMAHASSNDHPWAALLALLLVFRRPKGKYRVGRMTALSEHMPGC